MHSQVSRSRTLWVGGLTLGIGAYTVVANELETRKAVAALDKGSKTSAAPDVPRGKLLDRPHLQNRLLDLLHPYVCSMSHIDIVHHHTGCGCSTELLRAISDVPGGSLYVDLQGSSEVGTHVLHVLTGEPGRSPFQRFRDLLSGGRDAYGLKLLDVAAERYLATTERYPVVAFDHVDPSATRLGDATGPLARLGRRRDADAPALRAVVALNDAGLETLQRDADPDFDFRVVAVGDATSDEALSLLLAHRLPRELAERVVALTGGRMSHVQEAATYWDDAPRWLSPMRPGVSQQDGGTSIDAHFAEIKKMIFWDLDKRLRISAGIALWPAATGDAPVDHQSPTDEDAAQIIELLAAVSEAPVTAAAVRASVGEQRFSRLLAAQVLGFGALEGPLHMRGDEAVVIGSPALSRYFAERLAAPAVPATAAGAAAGATRSSWWPAFVFGGR